MYIVAIAIKLRKKKIKLNLYVAVILNKIQCIQLLKLCFEPFYLLTNLSQAYRLL